MFAALLLAVFTAGPRPGPDPAARAVLDTAVARMGGVSALTAIERARVEMITEWQRTTLDPRLHPPVQGYEWSTELRDYTRPAWRYTRRFFSANGLQEIVDLVVDSVALIRNPKGVWSAQNVAYVDERLEQFTFTPERLVLLAHHDEAARALADTTIAGTRYARVRATVSGFATTLHFGRADGALALATFRAAQPRDFGLAPWGDMDVAIWYSNWQRLRDGGGVTVPTQLDVYRIGKPYKRMTTVSVQINPQIPADSFAVADSLRAAFLAQHNRAMYDLPVDSAKIVDGRFATFGAWGTPSGAVKLGTSWLLLEAGTAPLSIERSAGFLAKADAGSSLGGALVTAPIGQGGLAWLADRGVATWVPAGVRAYASEVLRGWKKSDRTKPVPADRWLRLGGDSARVETIDVPDYPRTTVLYVPSLRWVYAWAAASPVVLERVAAYARSRGWAVDRVGSARSFVGVAPPPAVAAGTR
jgi:hypothetical protein